MNHLDLFAGIGGFSLAASRTGMTTVGHSEIDKYANGCLQKNFPNIPNYGNVEHILGKDLPDVDIITAGSPCQDYSLAGRRQGTKGKRSGLISHTFRLIEETKAEWIVIENVPGLLSSNGGRDFGAVLGTLADLGMGFAWRVLDAQAFGVPQRRRRLFIVGRTGGLHESPAKVLSVGEGMQRDTPPSKEARSKDSGEAPGSARNPGVAGTLAASSLGGGGPEAKMAFAGHIVPVAMAENQRAELREMDCFGALASFPSGKPGQGKPVIVHKKRVRKLTPVECERLQGFPDEWTQGSSDTQRYRQLGNSVAMPVVSWIHRRISKEK